MESIKLSEKEKQRIQIRHKHSIEHFGYQANALFWSSTEMQELRFKIIWEMIQADLKSPSFSLLDVGCGFGDLSHYLKRHQQACDYTGLDISPDMVFSGKCQYPGIQLFEGELFDFDWPMSSFDWVVLSGSLNEVVDETGDYAKAVIRKMYELSRQGVVFNLLDARNEWIASRPDLQSFYPEAMQAFCQTFCDQVTLKDDYMDNDYTLYLKKAK